MYIYFQRTILEQTDSILCLNKILGKNCKKTKTYNKYVQALFFGDINRNKSKFIRHVNCI